MTTDTVRTALVHARIISSSGSLEAVADGAIEEADCVVIEGDRIAEVHSVDAARNPTADLTMDLEGRFVVPGFVDSHVHLLWLGAGLSSVALTDAGELTEIQQRLRDARRALGADATMLRGRGWLFDAVDGEPTAAMIDEAVSDIPVFLDSNDMHSIWVNSAALKAMGLDASTADPAGGRLSRLPDGSPAGMLYERAAHDLGWAYLSSVTSDQDREGHIGRALETFAAAGVTSVVDMGMDEDGWRALLGYAKRLGGRLPVRVSAHWLVVDAGDRAANLAQVERVLKLCGDPTPWLELVGIKLVLDGVIDACTAAMSYPYADGSNGDLLWSPEALLPVLVAADAARLRLAIHAIGDLASDMALDVLEEVIRVNPQWDRRPRLEHLEVVSDLTPARMARLGITASVQPVHSDPAIQPNWRAQLGDDRVERGYPWTEFTAAGARLAFGTDAPTAPHEALTNLYIATTRRSATDHSLPPNEPRFTVSVDAALRHATFDSAASFDADLRIGRVRSGMFADLVVLDGDFLGGNLLQVSVVRTIVGGVTVFEKEQIETHG
ncbi:amidohydrolase [Rhodococcus sp. P1Y]|uniref:amidohydrolase n=1 Tax=Rhodococcus sp. P1Y TaxID=1302308 RepID=UPI000EAECF21|nr:amidohydrolase [Rhodococcus sp. P1Y]AYJ48265.1 amidohydrolase [Rhodococcus sp. P1Y]